MSQIQGSLGKLLIFALHGTGMPTKPCLLPSFHMLLQTTRGRCLGKSSLPCSMPCGSESQAVNLRPESQSLDRSPRVESCLGTKLLLPLPSSLLLRPTAHVSPPLAISLLATSSHQFGKHGVRLSRAVVFQPLIAKSSGHPDLSQHRGDALPVVSNLACIRVQLNLSVWLPHTFFFFPPGHVISVSAGLSHFSTAVKRHHDQGDLQKKAFH